MTSGRDLLDEQIAYYRARASEYDRTSTSEAGSPYDVHGREMREAVERLGPFGRVLEIAAGTGQWTGLLAAHADQLLAVDSSPEMLALNARRTLDPRVRYSVADAFALEPSPVHDTVFFGFFLSHVPRDRFDDFWAVVAGQLAPGGRALFVDEARHDEWREDWLDEERGIVRRTLSDGTVHRAVKVLWTERDLEHRLRSIGWSPTIRRFGPFYCGVARR